jgi:hypothetical protein
MGYCSRLTPLRRRRRRLSATFERLLCGKPLGASSFRFGSGPADQLGRKESYVNMNRSATSRVTGDEGTAGVPRVGRRMTGDRPR